MNKTTSERRAHARFPATFEVEGKPRGGAVARMVARDLSAGGLYCTSPTDFPEMTRLAVRLLLDGEGDGAGPLDLEAVVVRRRPVPSHGGLEPRYELALFFTNVRAGERRRLERFLRTR